MQRNMAEFLRDKQIEVEVCKEKPNLDAIRSILMLYEEIDVNLCDPNGRVGLIHQAARYGADDLVAMCLDRGVDPNVQTTLGRSAIHFAASENRAGAIDILSQDPRCNINLKTIAGLTALHLACRGNKRDVVMYLTSQTYHDLDIDAEAPDRKKAIEMTTSKEIRSLLESYAKRKKLYNALPAIVESKQAATAPLVHNNPIEDSV